MHASFSLRTLMVLLLAAPVGSAATLFWDADGSSSAATGGTGGWNTASTWRDGSSTGPLGNWVGGSDAVLAGTSGIIDLNTVSVTAGSVSVQTSGYTVTTSTSTRSLSATSLSLASGVSFALQKTGTAGVSHTIGSVSGGSSTTLELRSAVTSASSELRVNISGSVDAPVVVSGTGTSPVGFVGNSPTSSIDRSITNNSSGPTLLGAAFANNSLAVNAPVTGTAGAYFGITNGSNLGAGTVSLNAGNTFSGATTIRMNNAGVVDAKVDAALGSTSAVDVVNGTLLLSGGSGVTDRVNDSAPVTLGSSATTTAAIRSSGAVTETFGALTLAGAGTRIIDFGTTSGLLTFASMASSSAGLALQIWNWSGLLTGGGTDRLIATGGFGSNINLSNITFYSDSGTTSLGTARWVAGTSGELVPVPEPGALAALAALAAACGWRERRTRLRAC